MSTDHGITAAPEKVFNRGFGKLKAKGFLTADNLLAFHYKATGDCVFEAARQHTVKQPENRPHPLLIGKKPAIVQAQAVAMRDMHLQSACPDLGLLSQTGYAERPKSSRTGEKIAIAVHKTDHGTVSTQSLQALKNRQHLLLHDAVVGPEIEKIAKYIQMPATGAHMFNKFYKCLLPCTIVKAKMRISNKKNIRHTGHSLTMSGR